VITIKLKGGLGNQMFQYAFGRNLSYQQKIALRLDKSFLNRPIWQKIIGITPRKYELNEFNIKAKLTETKSKNYLEDYWQNEKYFKNIRNILLKDFTLKKESSDFKKLAKNIFQTNSVSIHIRRGDYAKSWKTKKYHGLISLNYYQKAYKIIIKKVDNPAFFVFSDDTNWVKKNLKINHPIIYVSCFNKLTNAEELILMSICKHNIIANSSFSWWGAWLNKNSSKIVIAPKRWFAEKNDYEDIVPQDWIRV
jgi:hypothetical protein